jgi:hypothetical protein
MILMVGCAGESIDDPESGFFAIPPPPTGCTPGQSELCVASDGRDGWRWCLGVIGMWSPCLAESYCGDGTCDASDLETRESCEDCHVCGDGFCDYTEDAVSCVADCQECAPDVPYCDADYVRLCASDGGASVVAEDCSVSGPLSTCLECPSTGEVGCGSPIPLITGNIAGVLDATPLTHWAQYECPGETWVEAHYDSNTGLSVDIMLPTGEELSIWVDWWGVINGHVHSFGWSNIYYPVIQIDAWDLSYAWQNHARCWSCPAAPDGTFVVSWLGELEPGSVIHVVGEGGMTRTAGETWSPFSFNLFTLVL